jgi:hypothetical protein
VWYSSTQNDFSPGAAIFSLHRLASPSGRNVNYDEKQLSEGGGGGWNFELFLLSVQVCVLSSVFADDWKEPVASLLATERIIRADWIKIIIFVQSLLFHYEFKY